MGLTAKQEKFCRGVVKGLTYSDAYREAYNVDNMKPETVNNSAFKLIQNGDITARISELKGKIEEKLIYSAARSFEKLDQIQDKALNRMRVIPGRGDDKSVEIEDPDFGAAIRAEELKGRLANLYKDVKDVKITGVDAFVSFYNKICEKKDYVK